MPIVLMISLYKYFLCPITFPTVSSNLPSCRKQCGLSDCKVQTIPSTVNTYTLMYTDTCLRTLAYIIEITMKYS